ncbi:MAG: Gldg family protein [Planctomycetota bacterium]
MTNLKLQIWIGVAFVVVNVAFFNLILQRSNSMRADLTEGKIYSLSKVTEGIIGSLDEEVVVKVFLSKDENLPEELRPVVPQIQDLLREYGARSDGRVRVSFYVPEDDEDAERKAQDTYNIQPLAFLFKGKSEQGVRSFFFGIAVEYAGTRPETIPYQDLVSQGSVFDREPKVQLKSVEFALTRAIKKVVHGFENQRGVFARFGGKAVISTWISAAEELPESFAKFPAEAKKVFEELTAEAGGKLEYRPQLIPKDEDGQRMLMASAGVRPISFPLSDQAFYLWAKIEIDGKPANLLPLLTLDGPFSEFDLKSQFEGYFRRLSPGSLRTIGIVQKSPPPPNPMMGMRGGAPRAPFAQLEAMLSDEYEVRSLDAGTLSSVPPEIDVLIVTGRDRIEEKGAYAIDQYIMSGGKAIFLTDRHHAEFQQAFALTSSARDSGLENLLASWGVEVGKDIAMDADNAGEFFWAVGRAGTRQRTVNFRWAAFPQLGRESSTANRDAPFMSGFELARLRFPSPLTITDKKGIDSTWLLRSSERTWTVDPSQSLAPIVDKYPDTGVAVPSEKELKQRVFAVLLEGEFPSYWAKRSIPGSLDSEHADDEEHQDGDEHEKEGDEKHDADEDGKESEHKEPKTQATAPLKLSRRTRVIVVGNDDWLDDMEAGLSQNIGPPYGLFSLNQRFMLDAIGWMLEDDDLIRIRNRGRSYRPLERLEDGEAERIQLWNFLVPIGLLALIGIVTVIQRRQRKAAL